MINLLTQQFGSMPSNTKRKSKNLNKTTNFGSFRKKKRSVNNPSTSRSSAFNNKSNKFLAKPQKKGLKPIA